MGRPRELEASRSVLIFVGSPGVGSLGIIFGNCFESDVLIDDADRERERDLEYWRSSRLRSRSRSRASLFAFCSKYAWALIAAVLVLAASPATSLALDLLRERALLSSELERSWS